VSDQYDSLAQHLAEQLRRWIPADARVILHLRGPDIETGGTPNELAITWEMPPPDADRVDRGDS